MLSTKHEKGPRREMYVKHMLNIETYFINVDVN